MRISVALLTVPVLLLGLVAPARAAEPASAPGLDPGRDPGSAPASASAVRPLAHAHAHNDYEHTRPLLDALDHGFTSVEADVWLVDGELYLGHDAPDLSRTLTAYYLQPLADRVAASGGSVYPGWRNGFQLLIDVKSDAASTWPVIEQKLAAFPGLFTTYDDGAVRRGPVTAVISGNRDLAAMQAATVRRSFYDARLDELDDGLPSSLVAMVSEDWKTTFLWRGVGPFLGERRLERIVDDAHARGYTVRFWDTPDVDAPRRERVWQAELDAGVDWLNTDDLAGLQDFLNSR